MKVKTVRLRFEPGRRPRIIFKTIDRQEHSLTLQSTDPGIANQTLNNYKAQIDLGILDISKIFASYKQDHVNLKSFFERYLKHRKNEIKQGRLSVRT